MQGSTSGNITIKGMGYRMDWTRARFIATREGVSSDIDITCPAGPKTEKTISLRVSLSELRALIEWLEA
jgi:hypothetical protein